LNYEGDKAEDGAGGMERRWKIWKELLEETNGELEERIISLFLEEERTVFEKRVERWRSSAREENVVMRLVEGEE